MKIKTQIVLVMSLLIVVTATSFSCIIYRSAKKALMEGIDNRLLTAARCARAILPDDYHDRITDDRSLSAEAFDRIVDRNNKICQDLGLQYLWSVMLVNSSVVFTTSTSPGKDITRHDYATFFEIHTTPDFFDTVFATMQIVHDSFDNKWGRGRSVLVPYTDCHGRKYCFGASMNTGDIDTMLRQAMTLPLWLTVIVGIAGISVSFFLASRLSEPIVRLTSVAGEIAKGNFDQNPASGGGAEIASLSQSIAAMSVSIRDKIASISESQQRFHSLFDNMTEGVAIHEVVYDAGGRAVNYRIMDVNPAYQKHTGLDPATARGKLATELYGTDAAPYLPIWAKVAETGTPHYSDVYFAPMKRHFSIAACSPRKGWFATVFTDITGRKLMEEKLRQSEEKFRTLVETSSDWLWEVDRNGLYTYVSPRVRDLLGYEPDELIGKKPTFLMPAEEAERVDKCLKEHITTCKPFVNFENVNLHKQGRPVVLETSGLPTYDTNGRFTGFRGIDRDITDRKQADEAIRVLNRELEQRVKDRTLQLELANKELRTFAYSVSHDLRAPLRSIDGFSKAILEDYADKLDDEGRDYLNRLRRASQRMASLIDNLLQLSRVTSGDMHLSSVNLSQLATSVLKDLHENDRHRKVTTLVTPNLESTADPQLITVVLENLLGNAWKFTSKKQNATIEFGAQNSPSGPAYYVRDNGIGFDMAFVDKLFVAFQRLHAVTDYPGNGIGLASVQRIIHRHGGRVWAEGNPDKGATFYFTLG